MDIDGENLYNKRICVIGMGYVGLTLALTFSDLGFKVIGIEKRQNIIDNLTQGRAHFYEAGLNQILENELGKGFKLLTKLEESISDIYIVAVGTPVDFGRKPDFSSLEGISKIIGKILKKGDLVVLRSTVSPGTTRNFVIPLLELESGLKAGEDFYISFTPERTIEGNALEELKTLPQIIGGINAESNLYTANLFRKITSQIVLVNSLEVAEMIKLANNLCRDVNFGFANEMALICDKFNLDANEVINAANFGYPRNKISLPSPGVGGYCLTKDSYILIDAVEKKGYTPKIILSAREVNEQMPKYVADQVYKFFKLKNKSIDTAKFYILGFAFKGKPDTSDIRFSPAIDVLSHLKEMGAKNFYGYDHVVDKQTIINMGIKFIKPEEGFLDVDCVLVMNNHPFFASLDIVNYLNKSNKPALFIDTWRLFSPLKILNIENIYYSNLGFNNFS